MRICLNENCSNEVIGRADRKFCCEYCKSDYHYKLRKESGAEYFKHGVDAVLRKNRTLLKQYNLAGKAWVRKDELLEKGFNSRVFTHYWRNKKGEVYLFCYDQGFMETTDNGQKKYLLIQWQDYMKDQVF